MQTQRNTIIWNAYKAQPFSGVHIQQWLIQIRITNTSGTAVQEKADTNEEV